MGEIEADETVERPKRDADDQDVRQSEEGLFTGEDDQLEESAPRRADIPAAVRGLRIAPHLILLTPS